MSRLGLGLELGDRVAGVSYAPLSNASLVMMLIGDSRVSIAIIRARACVCVCVCVCACDSM